MVRWHYYCRILLVLGVIRTTMFLVGFGGDTYYNVFVCLSFFLFTCMAIDLNVRYNGGLLPDIILLSQCYYHRRTRSNAINIFLTLQPMIPLKHFDIFPPVWDPQNV